MSAVENTIGVALQKKKSANYPSPIFEMAEKLLLSRGFALTAIRVDEERGTILVAGMKIVIERAED